MSPRIVFAMALLLLPAAALSAPAAKGHAAPSRSPGPPPPREDDRPLAGASCCGADMHTPEKCAGGRVEQLASRGRASARAPRVEVPATRSDPPAPRAKSKSARVRSAPVTPPMLLGPPPKARDQEPPVTVM